MGMRYLCAQAHTQVSISGIYLVTCSLDLHMCTYIFIRDIPINIVCAFVWLRGMQRSVSMGS